MGIEFVGGPVAGPLEDRDAGCVWWESKRPWGRDFNIEENIFKVRVFRRWQQDQPMTTAENVEPLEQDAEALEAALKSLITSEGFDYFNVVDVHPDYERQFVEATLLPYDMNRSATGG